MARADGGVINTFTITGRDGANGCNLRQHDFAREIENRNIIFRIPSPVFGAGLIEQIPDATILANQAANSSRKRDLGISGRAEPQRQRRHHLAFRLEGAEPDAAAVLRRGLQRGDGNHQRAVPVGARAEPRLPVRHGSQRHAELRSRPTPLPVPRRSRTSPTSSASSRRRRRRPTARAAPRRSAGARACSAASAARCATRPRSRPATPRSPR